MGTMDRSFLDVICPSSLPEGFGEGEGRESGLMQGLQVAGIWTVIYWVSGQDGIT